MKRTTKKADTPTVKEPTPMDPSVRESAVGTPATNRQRECWAIKTLVAEVLAIFPETPVEYSNYDGRGTALTVAFDLTSLDEDDRIDLSALLSFLGDEAYNDDPRVAEVLMTADAVLVSMHPNARTQDSRDTFGLGNAVSVLGGGPDADADEDSLPAWADANEDPENGVSE